jgi:hypothetical protein
VAENGLGAQSALPAASSASMQKGRQDLSFSALTGATRDQQRPGPLSALLAAGAGAGAVPMRRLCAGGCRFLRGMALAS